MCRDAKPVQVPCAAPRRLGLGDLAARKYLAANEETAAARLIRHAGNVLLHVAGR